LLEWFWTSSFAKWSIAVSVDAPAAFFSYSREDSEFTLRLAEDLKAAGANVWLDQLDIAPGQRWDRSVEDALSNCPRLLVVLSPASIKSTNVMDEVSFALENQKTVIPVLYRDCAIPFRLRRIQYLDFRSDYELGLKGLLKNLEVRQPVELPTPAPAPLPSTREPRVLDAQRHERADDETALLAESRTNFLEEERLGEHKVTLDRHPHAERNQGRVAAEQQGWPQQTPRKPVGRVSGFLSTVSGKVVFIASCGSLLLALFLWWALSRPPSTQQTMQTQKPQAAVTATSPDASGVSPSTKEQGPPAVNEQKNEQKKDKPAASRPAQGTSRQSEARRAQSSASAGAAISDRATSSVTKSQPPKPSPPLEASSIGLAKTWDGWISDAKCAAKGANAAHAACAKKCVEKGEKPVLVTDKDQKVVAIANPAVVSGHEGQHVKVTGTMTSDGAVQVGKLTELAAQ
jgi:hypothetical protein